jgi:periplasmic protein CpxP/Spy
MTIKSTSLAAALWGSLLLPAVALPTAAFAQTEIPGGGDAASPRPKAAPPHSKPRKPVASPAERVEQHITQLHAQLQITPAQQAQWDQFAAVMRENAKGMRQTLDRRGAGFATMTAVDNMNSYTQIAQEHAQDMQKLAIAFQPLYAAMSDEQKKNADAVFQTRGARSHMKPKMKPRMEH